MYLLDTNHCSFAFARRDAEVIQKLDSLPINTEISINSIIYGELMVMVEKSQRKEENRFLLNEFMRERKLKVYPIEKKTSQIYGEFHAEMFAKFAPKDVAKRRKFDIQEAGVRTHDLWIACTVIQHDLVLVSEDRDFQVMSQVRKLKLECWKTR